MLSQSADYALRAVLFVAQRADRRSCTADAIARTLGVPRNYLGKVLHALAGAGVLTSVRGPHGGFQLAKNAEQLTLAEVVSPFHRVQERTTCLRGDHACDLANPCRSHAHWQVMTSMLTSFFQKTTIATLLRGGDEANAQPSQPPVAQELSGTAATEFTPRRRVS